MQIQSCKSNLANPTIQIRHLSAGDAIMRLYKKTHNRSDCHAWGGSPNIEFYRTILGIDSYAPGFSKIKTEPHLGDLKEIAGEIPHPNGEIAIKYELKREKWNIEVILLPGTSGIFVHKGQNTSLTLVKTG